MTTCIIALIGYCVPVDYTVTVRLFFRPVRFVRFLGVTEIGSNAPKLPIFRVPTRTVWERYTDVKHVLYVHYIITGCLSVFQKSPTRIRTFFHFEADYKYQSIRAACRRQICRGKYGKFAAASCRHTLILAASCRISGIIKYQLLRLN